MYLNICLCTNLNQSNTDWKVGYRIINLTTVRLSLIQPVFDTFDILNCLWFSALNSYILTSYALKKTPIDIEVKGQGNKFLYFVSLIYTNKHFILKNELFQSCLNRVSIVSLIWHIISMTQRRSIFHCHIFKTRGPL